MYLLQVLKLFDVKITKLASGILMGSNIEFSDNQTIAQALEGRIEYKLKSCTGSATFFILLCKQKLICSFQNKSVFLFFILA